MSVTPIKQKIQKSLDTMNEDELRSAFLILQEIKNGNQKIAINKEVVDANISIGLHQLKNGLGRNFSSFLNDAKVKYGSNK